MSSAPKVIIVGIDGATWSLITPWVEQGLLPNFARMMQQGRWGNLQSTVPPVTAPAWSSMITGCNPGKHGLFDFTAHAKDQYQADYTYGGLRRCPTIWKTLSDRGYRVGVVNVPMTYPPEPVNGFMISGLDTPDETSPFIYPEDLQQQLKEKFGRGVRLDIRHLGYMKDDSKRATVLKELMAIEDERLALVTHLAQQHPVDALMFVINATDQAQHHFWHYMDAQHPQHDAAGAKEFGDAILKVYRKVDGLLAQLLNQYGDETLFMLVSDHGFQATSDAQIHINKALAQAGLLKFHQDVSWKAGVASHVSSTLKKMLSPKMKQTLAGMLPGARAKLETMSVMALVDWEQTKAYSFESMVTSPNIWINLKGKRPQGIVAEQDYRQVVEEVKACLTALTHPVTGQQLIPQVLEKQEVYHGPALDEAPDLIPVWWASPGFTPKASVDGGRVVRNDVVEVVSESLQGGQDWSGTHSAEGVVLLYGPQVQPGRLHQANIVDIAPTLFAALQEAPDAEFDGKSLLGSVGEVANANSAGEVKADSEESSQVTVSAEDRAKIKERLRLLGYLE